MSLCASLRSVRLMVLVVGNGGRLDGKGAEMTRTAGSLLRFSKIADGHGRRAWRKKGSRARKNEYGCVGIEAADAQQDMEMWMG